MALVDVVVVSYNSRAHLRSCVEPLARLDDVNVIVVDNASADGSLETVADLPVTAIARTTNAGFAAGSNEGWRAGSAPFVLFLNPDATLDERSLRALVGALEQDERPGGAAPRIVHPDGSLAWSQRRFPRLRSTYAQALFLHRLFPRSRWSDDLFRDPGAYETPGYPEWVSGGCVLTRRSVLDELGGWDEGYFMYCEDVDLCRRLWQLGRPVRFEPAATAVHHEGESAPRSVTLPILAASRIRYAQGNRTRIAAVLERIGIGLGALTHIVLSRGGMADRAAHVRSLRVAAGAPSRSASAAGAER